MLVQMPEDVSSNGSISNLEMLATIRRRKIELLDEIKSLEDEINDVSAQIDSMDLLEENKMSSHTKKLSTGKKKFNMDPDKGITYMIENGILQSSAEDVAYFLYHGEGLNKTAIGEYLGEKKPFNIQVMNNFVKLHEFTNMILVQALRQFLWSFRLPGEAQKIDRLMECFARHYCTCNPGVFQHTDTCYILSYSIIMLNTSLHNPSVKEKPSLQRFLDMNKGIDCGNDLPDHLLTSLYNSIKKEPFKIPEDDGNDLMHTFFNPVKEGWLWKQGGRYKTWKRRWFVLADGCLYYFQFTTDKEPRGIIPLQNLKIRVVPSTFTPNANNNNSSGLHHKLAKFKNVSTNNSKKCQTTTDASSVQSRLNKTSCDETNSSTTNSSLNPSSAIIHHTHHTSNMFEILPIIENEIIKACKKSENSEGGRVVEGKHCVYRMSAASPDEAQAWVSALSAQTRVYLTHNHQRILGSAGYINSSIYRSKAPNVTTLNTSLSADGFSNLTNPHTFRNSASSYDGVEIDGTISAYEQQNQASENTYNQGPGIHLYQELLSLRRQYNNNNDAPS